jgi:predicted dehydrogenase
MDRRTRTSLTGNDASPGTQGPNVTRRAFVAGGAATALTTASYARVAGANDRVGVGFIGYGLIGRRHVADFLAQPDVDPVAVAEAHAGRLDEAKAATGGRARALGDFRRLLDDRDVHAVVVSTPDHWHALMTMIACAAGKDVYVEKPLTLFVREGRWMVDVARRHGRVVQVGTQQRSGPHYQRAREMIRAGRIGAVHSVRMGAFRNIMPGYGTPADQDPPPGLDWDMIQGPAPAHPYNPNRAIYHFRWFWDYSGGQMTNLGQHALDVVHWFLDLQAPRAVTSVGGRYSLRDNGETPDQQDTLFEYPGLTVLWSHREAARGLPAPYPIEFLGTKGSLAISRMGFVVTPDRKREPGTTIPQFDGRRRNAAPEAPSSPSDALWTEAAQDRTGDEYDQFRRHVRDFLDCVKSRKTPIADLESGHRVVTACHLANLSLRLGRKIRWDAERETMIEDAEAERMLERPYRAPWDEMRKALIGG